MTLEREASTRARRWNLKLVDDLLPELVGCDALKATSQNGGFEQFAQVELFTTDLGHFEILHSEIFLKLNELVFKLATLALLVICIEEFQLFWQSNIGLVAHIWSDHLFL